jgi:hypothetical protein
MSEKYDWRWENSISHTKERVEGDEHKYVPWRTNRYLSRFIDSLAHAQEMNLLPHLDPAMQYDYLFWAVRKRRRFAKGVRPDRSDDLEVVAEHYGYDRDKAREALRILTDAEVTQLKLNRGA